MKFLQLEILNLASLDKQGGEVINFEEGALGESTIFSIVGPTGSGKSTLLDAICLALYNRAPRYPRKKGDKNQNIEIFGATDASENNRLAPTDSRNILTRGKKEGYSKLIFLANNGSIYRAEWHVRFQRVRYENAKTALYKINEKRRRDNRGSCRLERAAEHHRTRLRPVSPYRAHRPRLVCQLPDGKGKRAVRTPGKTHRMRGNLYEHRY